MLIFPPALPDSKHANLPINTTSSKSKVPPSQPKLTLLLPLERRPFALTGAGGFAHLLDKIGVLLAMNVCSLRLCRCWFRVFFECRLGAKQTSGFVASFVGRSLVPMLHKLPDILTFASGFGDQHSIRNSLRWVNDVCLYFHVFAMDFGFGSSSLHSRVGVAPRCWP